MRCGCGQQRGGVALGSGPGSPGCGGDCGPVPAPPASCTSQVPMVGNI